MRRDALARLRSTLKTPSQRRLFDEIVALPGHTQLLYRDDKATGERHFDAQTLPVFARQLEQVLTEVEREEFPELPMANGEILPLDTSIDEGAETFTYYILSASGVARFVGAYSTGSIPMVSLQGAAVSGRVENMAIGYRYSTKEIRAASFAGIPLDAELGVAARRAHEELLHKTGLWGREDLGIPGLFNHPNITVTDAPATGTAGSRLWTAKTVDLMIADVALLLSTPADLTGDVEKPNRVYISPRRYRLLQYSRLTSGGGDASYPTALKFLEDVHQGVEFKPLAELQADLSDGHLAADAMFAYQAGNKRKAALMVPMPFKQYPVQMHDLDFKVPTESSTAGVKLTRPLMCHLMVGI
jgi:hypothetical protein